MKLYCGDAYKVLRDIEDESIQTCITSPPYWGLRDYGIDGQLGHESTPAEYVGNLVSVFNEVHRVLHKSGTLWLNLGDTYITRGGTGAPGKAGCRPGRTHTQRTLIKKRPQEGLKNKDLVGIPWMVAFALREAGWYLRQDIIWAKRNPLPESVTDRCVKSHEYLFLLTKSEKYQFNHLAIREPALSAGSRESVKRGGFVGKGEALRGLEPFRAVVEKRNKRSVWSLSSKPFKGAHFAVFPPDLVEPCLLAGTEAGQQVLDPFMGAGTVGVLAKKHGRAFTGIDINQEYVAMAMKRIRESS